MPTSICSFIAAKHAAAALPEGKCDVCHKICCVQSADTYGLVGVKHCYECFENFAMKKNAETLARLKAEHEAEDEEETDEQMKARGAMDEDGFVVCGHCGKGGGSHATEDCPDYDDEEDHTDDCTCNACEEEFTRLGEEAMK